MILGRLYCIEKKHMCVNLLLKPMKLHHEVAILHHEVIRVCAFAIIPLIQSLPVPRELTNVSCIWACIANAVPQESTDKKESTMHSLVDCYFAWYYTQVQQIITPQKEHEKQRITTLKYPN